MQVQGKVVVTGGANGIGKALAEIFHREGAAKIVVADLDCEGAQAVAAVIGDVAFKADVGNENDIRDVIEQTERQCGPIALFCSNAGIKARGGYFLNTVSAAGLLSQVGSAAYSTTKHAAVGFAENLAISHRAHGIRVSILCPQGVETNMLRGLPKWPQSVDGNLSPEKVAQSALDGIAREQFLILSHPQVAGYMRAKLDNYDRWIGGTAKIQAKLCEGN